MKQISRHISYLLLTCRKVNVPGLGTFTASCSQASFDLGLGVFYPAGIRITYKKDFSTDKNLLLDSVIRKLKVEEKEAERMIQEFVFNVKSTITKKHYCRLDGIGYLIDHKGSIQFKDTFWKLNKYPNASLVRV